jgi:AcrR family transcriptional regulator
MERPRLLSYDPPAPVEPSSVERIRDAALKAFAAHGIAATSLKSVAEAAGVSVGLVQHYFGTKAALMVAVDEHVLRLVGDAMESEPLPTSPSESLNEAGRRVTNLFAENPDVVDYLGRALLEGGTFGEEIFDGLLAVSAAQYDHFIEHQLARPDADPTWATINPLLLRMSAMIFRTHIERHLPEPLFAPAQLTRWDAAVTALIREGLMRDPGGSTTIASANEELTDTDRPAAMNVTLVPKGRRLSPAAGRVPKSAPRGPL